MLVTARDRNLLDKLHAYGMLSTKQINQIIFDGIAKTTTLRRLRILEKEKFIQRISGLESHEYLWGLTLVGAQIIGRDLIKKHWNKNLLDHDYKLLCLRLTLENLGVINTWKPEHELKHLAFQKYGFKEAKNRLIPDAIMLSGSGQNVKTNAIELELTLKNKERIKVIVQRYLTKKELSSVIYVASSKGIIRSFLSTWRMYKPKNHSSRLYGCLYDEVMQEKSNAPIYGLEGKQRLGELLGAHPSAHRLSNRTEHGARELNLVTTNNHTTLLELQS